MALFPSLTSLLIIILIFAILNFFSNSNNFSLEINEKFMIFTFLMYFVVNLFLVYYHEGELRNLDVPSRFFLLIPFYFYFRNFNFHREFFYYAIFFASFLLGLYSIIKFFLNICIFDFPIHTGTLSFYSGLFGLISLVIFLKIESLKLKKVSMISFALALIAALSFGGRGVWIAVIISLVILYLYHFKNFSLSSKLKHFASFIVFLFIGFLTLKTIDITRINHTYECIDTFFEDDIECYDLSIVYRLNLIKISREIFIDSPFFGQGENFQTNVKEYIDSKYEFLIFPKWLVQKNDFASSLSKLNHPHIEILTMLLKGGIIGLFFYLLVFISPILLFVKNKYIESDEAKLFKLLILMTVSFYFSYSLTNAVFSHQRTALLFVFLIFFLSGVYEKLKKEN